MKLANDKDVKFKSRDSIKINGRTFSGRSLYQLNMLRKQIQFRQVVAVGAIGDHNAIKVATPEIGVQTFVIEDIDLTIFLNKEEADHELAEIKRYDRLPKRKIVFSIPETLATAFYSKLNEESNSMNQNQKLMELIQEYLEEA